VGGCVYLDLVPVPDGRDTDSPDTDAPAGSVRNLPGPWFSPGGAVAQRGGLVWQLSDLHGVKLNKRVKSFTGILKRRACTTGYADFRFQLSTV